MNITVAEFDDYPTHAERMIKLMDSYKKENPSFKATLFAIPLRMTEDHFKMVEERKDWLRLGVHGVLHKNGECRNRKVRYLIKALKQAHRYDMVCKPPHYGFSARYINFMHSRGYAFSCRSAIDIYRHYESPLHCPTGIQAYCKYEQSYLKMFGHPKNTPFMFIPQTKRENMRTLKSTDKFLFTTEAVERKTMIS